MLTGQVIQNTIDGIRAITHASLAVCDTGGSVLSRTGEIRDVSPSLVGVFAASEAIEQSSGEFLFYKVFNEHDPEYVLVANTADPNSRMTIRLAAFQLESLNIAYKEKFDKDNFVKNLLLDNLLLIDIYNRARKLHIDINARRAVFIVESSGAENNPQDIIRKSFENEENFVTTVDENNTVLVKLIESEEEDTAAELRATALELEELISDGDADARVAWGTVINDIKEVSKSYKEARLALDVGRIFYEDKKLISYSNLGIGRLIYQLPINLCRMFITEIFGGRTPEELDEETLITIDKFFENNLNVSETSRQLFIHRNTLVYRLDKLQKATGLDLRVFEDAITFKIALMVVKYMDHIEKNNY